MKILLIGQSIIDHYEEFNRTGVKPGGLFYSSLGISSLSSSQDEIYLLTSLDRKYENLFSSVYNNFNTGLFEYSSSMPEVVLGLNGDGEREEVYMNISSSLDTEQLSAFDSFDGILINMITGFDISLDQLKWIRNKFDGPIYLDVHTLSRGLDSDLRREFRPIPNAEEWLANVTIIQCNESELKTLVEGDSIEESAAHVLSSGVKIILITRAEKGAVAYWNENGFLKEFSLEAEKIVSRNKVGCGDIFGASFFYSYISSGDVVASLILANKAGAIAASCNDLTSVKKINLL